MEDNTKMIIKANQVDYQKQAEKVYLKGNVSITNAIGLTTGEEIEFDLKTQEITANVIRCWLGQSVQQIPTP